jgi:hypothetical protein
MIIKGYGYPLNASSQQRWRNATGLNLSETL